MKITAALICAACAIVFAFLTAFWIRSKRGADSDSAGIYAILKKRNSNFRSFQYVPAVSAIVIVAVAEGFGLDWKQAAAFAAGAVSVILPVISGSFSFSEGVTASFYATVNGDMKQSVRIGYRTGSVLGSFITGICLAALCVMVLMLKTKGVLSYAASFALGASVVSTVIHTGGEVYSSAYSLAVSSHDFTDRTGSYISAGSDFAGSYILAAVSSMLLAEVAVATSGVTSTFTAGTPLRYPLLIYGAGVLASVIGVFISRAGLGNDLSRGSGIGCFAAAVITVCAAFYCSIEMMQTRVYAWAVTSGIASGLIIAAVSRLFSYDSRVFMSGYKSDRSLGRNMSAIFNLGNGMVASALYVFIIMCAAAVSYMFANYYGIALCAVGMCSVLGSFTAVTGLVSVSGSVSDILSSRLRSSDEDAVRAAADRLDNASVRNLVTVRSYASAAGIMTSVALSCAFVYVSGADSVDIMALRVFGGVVAGAATAFLLSGILIGSVRMTGRVALRDLGRNDDDTGAASAVRGSLVPAFLAVLIPAVVGLFIGTKALAGFLIASSVTGYIFIITTNNSGMYYENTAIQSLSSLLKMMAVFSVAFLPVFIRVGGFLFQ